MIYDADKCHKLVEHQLSSFFIDFNSDVIRKNVPIALDMMEENYLSSADIRKNKDGKAIFSPLFSCTWAVFLHRLSKLCANDGATEEADMLYYLNKIMNSVDWYHGIELPVHFCAEHPLGSVLGRAKYGDFFYIYQGVTVGGVIKNGDTIYPRLGNRILMYANSSIIGDCSIGNNVIVTANTHIVNCDIPDNSMVFGSSKNIVIKKRSAEELNEHFDVIWKPF